MKRNIPGPIEMSLFVAMAIISALVVAVSPQRDVALAFCTVPMFFVAAVLGFRRSELAQVRQPVEEVNDSSPIAE